MADSPNSPDPDSPQALLFYLSAHSVALDSFSQRQGHRFVIADPWIVRPLPLLHHRQPIGAGGGVGTEMEDVDASGKGDDVECRRPAAGSVVEVEGGVFVD